MPEQELVPVNIPSPSAVYPDHQRCIARLDGNRCYRKREHLGNHKTWQLAWRLTRWQTTDPETGREYAEQDRRFRPSDVNGDSGG